MSELSNKEKVQKGKFKRIISKYGIFIALIVLMVIMTVLSDSFLTSRNIMNVIRQIAVIAIIGMGVTMIIITTGTDLSSGSVLALVGVVAASLAKGEGSSVTVAIIVGIAVGAFTGLINGAFTAYGNVPAFIATLGMMLAARGAALIYSDGKPITGLSKSFEFIGGGYLFGIPFPIFIVLIAGIISHILLRHTKLGKYTYAIGGNMNAAFVSGVNVKKYLIIVYTYAGALTGLAGIVLASRLSAGQPTAGLAYEMDAIAAAVIGGTSFNGGIGTIPGTIVGALIIGVLNNGLDLLNVSAYWQQIVKAAIIVGAVLVDMNKTKKK